MTDLKTSLFVNRQVPEFVRDEHPKFILFLEAYYEFLDQNGYSKGKDLRYISDVDYSLEEFEQQFYNTFLPFVPRNVSINKEILIKNILPLYLSKGSEKSYRFLFRLLFDQEISLETPGKQILRASDGRWSQENVLRTDTNIYSEYVSDGITNTYYLPYIIDQTDFQIFINDELSENYEFRKETRKIIFDEVPQENSLIKISYKNFNSSILNSLQIKGKISGASAIVEKASRTNVGNLNFYQLFINQNNFFGTFIRSEIIQCNFNIDGIVIPIFLKLFSGLLKIDVINGGSSYNIGDPVIVRGPSETSAVAVIEDVVSGTIDDLLLISGGSGFKVGNEILAEGFIPSFFLGQVIAVDDSGRNSTNTISFNIDVINDYANVSIDSEDYGFPIEGTENVNTVISEALSSDVISELGPITLTTVLASQISTTTDPTFITQSTELFENFRISDLGGIGKIDIINGGENYEVGDQLIFTNVESFSGQGAEAFVSEVNGGGSITTVSIVDPGLSYQLEYLPEITVNSSNGVNANIIVSSILGTGADYEPFIEEGLPGQIKTIKVLSQGSGYEIVPGVDLSLSGDGNATANATLTEAFATLKGKWKTSDSILSDDQIRLQGRDYYIPYSYVISSQVEFNKYKEILKNLIHPAGLINYSKYIIRQTADSELAIDVESSLIKTVSGTVSISNNSNTVIGTNTEFTIASNLNIISEGIEIIIDDQVRSIISIDDEFTLTVDSEFNTTSNNTLIKIIS
jgi:hypothetical protein